MAIKKEGRRRSKKWKKVDFFRHFFPSNRIEESTLPKKKNIGLFFLLHLPYPLSLSLSPRSDPPKTMYEELLTPSKESGQVKSKSSSRAEASKAVTSIVDDVSKLLSDIEPLAQLRGSLEELVLVGPTSDYGNPSIGLRRFPESFLGLTNLNKLGLNYHFRIKAIPAGISNLKRTQRTRYRLMRPSLAAERAGRAHAARDA